MAAFVIELHLPQWLKRYEIFEVGTFGTYEEDATSKAQEWLEAVWKPLGEGIKKLLATANNPLIDLAISDHVLNLLSSSQGKPYLKAWEPILSHLNWRGSMPAPGFRYRFLDDAEHLADRVPPIISHWEKTLGRRPMGFYLPYGLYANPLAFGASQQGFDTLWAYDAQAKSGWYLPQHLPQMRLGVYGPDPQRDIRWFGHQILNQDGGIGQCLHALESYFLQSGNQPMDQVQPAHTYEWPYFERHAVFPRQGTLQQNFVSELHRFQGLNKQANDQEVHHRLQLLSQAHILQALNPSAGEWLGNYRNFSTPEDAWLSLMNMLADLELRLKQYG